MASESESSACAWAEAWSSFFRRSKSSGSAAVWVGLRLELGSTRVSCSTWSPIWGIRESGLGWAESMGGVRVDGAEARANLNKSNRFHQVAASESQSGTSCLGMCGCG